MGFKRDKRRYCGASCAGKANTPFRNHTGAKNVNYNGGLCTYKGRMMIVCRDYSTIWYSRALMMAHLGRELTSDEIVHHINGDGSDDRVENLQIMTRAEHAAHHGRLRSNLAAFNAQKGIEQRAKEAAN